MKRKLLIGVLTATLVFSIWGCKKEEPKEESTTEEATTEEPSEETETAVEEATTDATLDDIETYLLDEGVLDGDKSEVLAEMIGAKNGFAYGSVEIYEFDSTSTPASGEEIPVEGMDGISVVASAVNGNFVLVFANEEVNQEVIDAFNNFE